MKPFTVLPKSRLTVLKKPLGKHRQKKGILVQLLNNLRKRRNGWKQKSKTAPVEKRKTMELPLSSSALTGYLLTKQTCSKISDLPPRCSALRDSPTLIAIEHWICI